MWMKKKASRSIFVVVVLKERKEGRKEVRGEGENDWTHKFDYNDVVWDNVGDCCFWFEYVGRGCDLIYVCRFLMLMWKRKGWNERREIGNSLNN